MKYRYLGKRNLVCSKINVSWNVLGSIVETCIYVPCLLSFLLQEAGLHSSSCPLENCLLLKWIKWADVMGHYRTPQLCVLIMYFHLKAVFTLVQLVFQLCHAEQQLHWKSRSWPQSQALVNECLVLCAILIRMYVTEDLIL